MPDQLRIGSLITALFPEHRPGGHEQEGYRPAVVVGLPRLAGAPRFETAIVAPLTSDRGQAWAANSRRLYPRFPAGLAGLRSPSICLLDQVRALSVERVHRVRAQLSDVEYAPIREALQIVLDERGQVVHPRPH